MGDDDESPTWLKGGAWLPNHKGVLRWTEGVKPASWQDVRRTSCGSHTGISRHRDAHEPLCDLCRVTDRDYHRAWRSKAGTTDAA